MITPRLMNPNPEPPATLEGIGYFLIFLVVLIVWVVYSEYKKDHRNGKK
jgi:hypothetical protein